MASATVATPPAVSPPVLDDVAGLLRLSQPKPTIRNLGRILLAVWAVAVLGSLLGLNAPVLETIAVLTTLGASVYVMSQGIALRREVNAVEELEGLLAQRRAEEAAPQLHGLMSRPMRTPENRLRAMILLGGTLSRLGRTEDALAVYDELIEAERVGGPGGAVVKLARATEMLRADRLYDADRAIVDLRRLLDRGGVGVEIRQYNADLPTGAEPAALAGLRLVELYRDVKTGHLAEAIESFNANRAMLTAGLGHRVAGAYALAAIALHQSHRTEEAATRYAEATALGPLSDLVRRFPELWPLTQIYAATPVPPAFFPTPGTAHFSGPVK
ncbi:MAG: hypothetical protein QM754_20585 [Tepidisphaeraceae bacterium]